MKLRNKKTGEIKEWQKVGAIDYGELNEVYDAAEYNSLAELNEVWEDYEPAEPLIEDEKIRKAVRAWAEANKFSIFIVNNKQSNTFEIRGLTDIGDAYGCSIYFKGIISKTNNITYTINELCGEAE